MELADLAHKKGHVLLTPWQVYHQFASFCKISNFIIFRHSANYNMEDICTAETQFWVIAFNLKQLVDIIYPSRFYYYYSSQ
jgi:hypothetical protein